MFAAARWFMLFLVVVGATRPAWADPAIASAARADAPAPVILVLGDSLSAGYGLDAQTGWAALLQRRLVEQHYPHQVVNASVSGDTTSGGLARLPPALARHHPAITLVELGGNDGLRALPLKALRDNLGRLVDLAKGAGSQVLLMEMRIPPNYGAAYTQGFTASFGEVAAAKQVSLVPFFLAPLVDLQNGTVKPGAFQDDGIHPTAASQPAMLDAVWPQLQPLLKRP